MVAAMVAIGCFGAARPLPAAQFPDRCRGVGVDAVLVGSTIDPRITWLAMDRGMEKPLVWPPGWSARFTPALEVLDEGGVVRLRHGDRVSGVCLKGSANEPSSTMMIEGLGSR